MSVSEERLRELLPELETEGLLVRDCTGSTNADARALLGAASGEVLAAARAQTGGRGTHGRTFYSPPDTGLYLSVGLRRPPYPSRLTLAAGVAACEALRQVAGIGAGIKWVNDLWFGGRKCGGILCERTGDGDVIVGLGLNLREPEDGFPEELEAIAGALGVPADLENELAAAFFRQLCLLSRREDILPLYRQYCVTPGRRVRCLFPEGERLGTALSVEEDGSLLVRMEDETEHRLGSGAVTVIPEE